MKVENEIVKKRSVKLRTALLTGKAILLGVALHGISHGYVKSERILIQHATEMSEELIAELGLMRVAEAAQTPQVEARELSYEEMVVAEALEQGVNPALAVALMEHESRGNPLAMSPKGAIGLMQVMPANAKRCKLKDPGKLLDPRTNIRCGVQIFAEELKINPNPYLALQVYNGGPKCVNKCKESLGHAADVLARMARKTNI